MKLKCFYCEQEYDFNKHILCGFPPKGKSSNVNPQVEPICYSCYGENISEEKWNWGYKFKRFPDKYFMNETLDERLDIVNKLIKSGKLYLKDANFVK